MLVVMPPSTMDSRHERLASLQRRLEVLSDRGRRTAPCSPEREALLEEWAPVFAAVVALRQELEAQQDPTDRSTSFE